MKALLCNAFICLYEIGDALYHQSHTNKSDLKLIKICDAFNQFNQFNQEIKYSLVIVLMSNSLVRMQNPEDELRNFLGFYLS